MPWRVVIEGDTDALIVLAAELHGSSLAIEREASSGKFLLLATDVDREQDRPSAEQLAANLLARCAGIARLLIYDLDIDTRLRLEALELVSASPCTMPSRRVPSRAGDWFALAERDQRVARVFELIGPGVYWEEAAEIRTIISAAVGGEDVLVKRGVASSRELRRLTPDVPGSPLPRAVEGHHAADSAVLAILLRGLKLAAHVVDLVTRLSRAS
jgi:hypothetical protein